MYRMKFLLSFVILFVAFSSSAQKVKVKKGIAYVDGVAYVDLEDCDNLSCTYKSMNGTEILSVQWDSFEKANPVKRNPKSRSPYQATVTERYSIIKFFDFDLEFESKLVTRKKIIKSLYKNNVIDEEGNASEENAIRFAKKYGKDISGTRPIQVIRN